MTQPPRPPLARLPLVLAAFVLLLLPAAQAEEQKPVDLPPNVVAQIFGRGGEVVAELTFENLKSALVQHVLPELGEMGSAPTTILRELVEEWVVEQEARLLGLAVTPEEIRLYVAKLDTQLRTTSGGQQNLGQIRKAKGMTWERFQDSIRMLLLKEKVASNAKWLGKLPDNERQRLSQVAVVVTELLKRAKIVWHIAVDERMLQQAGQKEPVPAEAGAIVTVNGEVLARLALGKALLERLSDDVLKEVVDKECATKLLQVENVALDEAAMDEELKLREQNWAVQRTLASQAEWRNVGYEEFLKATLKKSIAELKADRYFRSFYGLVRRERAKVTEQMLEEEWKIKQTGLYGTAIVVDALQVGFERKNALLSASSVRDRREALAIAHGVLQQVQRGQSFVEVAADVVKQHANPRTRQPDPTVRSGERRLYNIQADQLLYNQASTLKDGEVSGVVETLSEVHVIRRKTSEPGPSYATVKEVMREGLAGRHAQYYMQEQAKDRTRVRVRWPIRIY